MSETAHKAQRSEWVSHFMLAFPLKSAFRSDMRSHFHLAIHVTDLEDARGFYRDILGCGEGRSSDTWVDFDFFGHQMSLHLGPVAQTYPTGHVDGQSVPMPHFGVVIALEEWSQLKTRLEKAGTAFEIAPQIRFEGQAGEHHIMFFRDPFGNAIEIKGFHDLDGLFQS